MCYYVTLNNGKNIKGFKNDHLLSKFYADHLEIYLVHLFHFNYISPPQKKNDMKRSNISIQVHKKKYLDVLLFYCVCGTLANMAKYRRENYRPHWTGSSL